MAGFVPAGLRQLQHDHLQSRDVGEVLGVRREQPEVTLDRLRRKPEVVDANVWISSGFSKSRSQAAENLGRFDGDPQLGFSAESTKHRSGSLLLRTGSQQRQAEPDFGDVHRREIHRILASDGVDISRSKRSAFNRDPYARVDQPAHGSRSSDTRPRRPFRCEAMAADRASAVSSSSVRYRSPNTLNAS